VLHPLPGESLVVRTVTQTGTSTMTAAILLCILALPTHASAAAPLEFTVTQDDADVDAAIQAAGKNIDKLLELATSYTEASRTAAAEKVHRRVIELDPDHEAARAGLRHQFYDGQWFESFVALAKYKREEAARMKGKGLGLFGDRWVPIEDVPFLSLGWKRNTSGSWVNPIEEAREKQVKVWMAEGYQFRADDNSWVAPDEFENWTKLLWKCGDAWVGLEDANKYHASLEQSWELMGEHFVTWTSASWETGNLARWHADQVHSHLVRLFGVEPKAKPHFVVLPSLVAYNDAAGGNVTLPESEGFSSLHGAYFSDACFDASVDPPQFIGTGVSYWDRSDPTLGAWGPFWLRWAAAQSYIDAIDRSWIAVGGRLTDRGATDGYAKNFWEEKRIPRWLRYGAAGYVERFLPNYEATEGADPWSLRTFSLEELKKSGGLRDLKDVFAFKLNLTDLPGSSRLYQEAGLVVAYLLDGAEGDRKLQAAHEGFRAALASGNGDEARASAKALESALLEREKAIRAFAGL